MDCDLLKILIQTSLTIVGWVVIIVWGLKQINISSAKNLDLQQTIIRENHRRELAKEVINIYKDIIVSFDNFLHAGNRFVSNYNLEHSELKATINFSASGLVEPINDAYNRLCSDIHRLDMWLKISSDSLPHSGSIKEAIDFYITNFTKSDSESGGSHWLALQTFLVVYQSGKLKNKEGLFEKWNKVRSALIDARNKLIEAVSMVNSELIKTYNH